MTHEARAAGASEDLLRRIGTLQGHPLWTFTARAGCLDKRASIVKLSPIVVAPGPYDSPRSCWLGAPPLEAEKAGGVGVSAAGVLLPAAPNLVLARPTRSPDGCLFLASKPP